MPDEAGGQRLSSGGVGAGGDAIAPGAGPAAPLGPGGLPIGAGERFFGGAPITVEVAPPGAVPLAPEQFGERGLSIAAPLLFTAGTPVGGPASIFNIGGAPITVLAGVFSGGLPLGGPVTQIFRGGSGPEPPTLFAQTLTPSGPIGGFFIGSGGAPIGAETFGGGALPIGLPAPVAQEAAAIQPRTALVGANPVIGTPPPALVFGSSQAQGPVPPIGAPGQNRGGQGR